MEDEAAKQQAAKEADEIWKKPKDAGSTQIGNFCVTPGSIKEHPEHPMLEEAEEQAERDSREEPDTGALGVFSQVKLPQDKKDEPEE